MTNNASRGTRTLGSLRSADGAGIVRIEDRYDTDIDDLWAAITDPDRLARWFGEVDGELSLGGEFRVHIADAGERIGRVEACDAPQRLLVTTTETDESYRRGQAVPPFDAARNITLTADGDQTTLVIEVKGMPLDKIAFFGAGWQIHAENLAAYLAGREPDDVEARGKNSSLLIRTWRPTSTNTRRQHSGDIPARWATGVAFRLSDRSVITGEVTRPLARLGRAGRCYSVSAHTTTCFRCRELR